MGHARSTPSLSALTLTPSLPALTLTPAGSGTRSRPLPPNTHSPLLLTPGHRDQYAAGPCPRVHVHHLLPRLTRQVG